MWSCATTDTAHALSSYLTFAEWRSAFRAELLKVRYAFFLMGQKKPRRHMHLTNEVWNGILALAPDLFVTQNKGLAQYFH